MQACLERLDEEYGGKVFQSWANLNLLNFVQFLITFQMFPIKLIIVKV